MLPTIIDAIFDTISTELPKILKAGLNILLALIQGIVECIPQLIEMLPTIIETIVDFILNNLPQIIEVGIEVLIALIERNNKSITTINKTNSKNYKRDSFNNYRKFTFNCRCRNRIVTFSNRTE